WASRRSRRCGRSPPRSRGASSRPRSTRTRAMARGRARAMAAEPPVVLAAVRDVRAWSAAAPRPAGLVPTMAALHHGTLSLFRRARRECDTTVVSIFVTPLQFAPGEDFERSPRRFDSDLSLLRREGVDAVFAPAVDEMSPPGATTRVRVGDLDA